MPEGGNVTTLSDENNQATELQIRGADGTIILRFVRTYNANGRVTEEKMIWENPAAYILDSIPETERDEVKQEVGTNGCNPELRPEASEGSDGSVLYLR